MVREQRSGNLSGARFEDCDCTTSGEEDVVDAGVDDLLGDVLDGGLIEDRYHLLRLGFGDGEESRLETRSGDRYFPDFDWPSLTTVVIEGLVCGVHIV